MSNFLSKLRKWRKVIPLLKQQSGMKLSTRENNYLLLNSIRSNGNFSVLKKKEDKVSVLYKNKTSLNARIYPHSDLFVLGQVFISEEYKPIVDYMLDNIPDSPPKRIIDAGANVGYTSLYFSHYFAGLEIICVEPDPNNFKMINENLAHLISGNKVKGYQRPLHGKSNINLKITTNFRDGKDWSLSVEESEQATGLKSITVNEILAENKWDHVDILKIDIEGAERFVFADDADLAYLKVTKFLAIEIHDEFNVRRMVNQKLTNNGFLVIDLRGTSFAINKKYI